GEHTLSYWPLAALAERAVAAERDTSANRGIVVLHFDAHRDAKESYMDVPFCHTTPMFSFLKEFGGKGKVDFVQIGIRQAGKDEEEFCRKMGVKTFYPKDLRGNLDGVKKFIKETTKGRNVYVTFDIDALDICYTPCTGTPEPFGLNPFEAVELFQSIDKSAKLAGADLVEVSVKNDDFREGTIGTQLILRLLGHCLGSSK
ncbi:arginase family protein, partial [Candidatus Woesearchaeota archaeon]|nr:arginase family protein [Candidatus Woesearchaeota archaeon]